MAISLIGVTTLVGHTTGLSVSTIVFSSLSPRNADVIFAWGGVFNSATTALIPIAPTSNSVNYVTLIASSTVVGGVEFGVWRKVAQSTDRIVFSSGGDTLSAAWGAMILRGVASTSPEDITTLSASGSSTVPQSPAIVTQFPNSWVLSLVGIQALSPLMTPPASFVNSTISAIANTGSVLRTMTVGGASFFQATTATVTPGVWTSTLTGSWLAVSVAVRAYVPPTSTEVPVDYPPELIMQPMIAR